MNLLGQVRDPEKLKIRPSLEIQAIIAYIWCFSDFQSICDSCFCFLVIIFRGSPNKRMTLVIEIHNATPRIL